MSGDRLRRSHRRGQLHKGFHGEPHRFFDCRSGSYEKELTEARESALKEMKQRAAELGANAIAGMPVHYEVLGSNGSNVFMVSTRGTAARTD
ncbi:heavy metal-binding domain-containing protein [Aminivibrio sp.]|uniref:heavy metal-binding domain-containing protein n=1 Tax=Aminivibrio sp. TaxID=1872489 RepID=UPI0025C26A3A|nr:heavy metal-binding domain-containing protein [Aminivibrio sp.]